jgi:hypothetical protein
MYAAMYDFLASPNYPEKKKSKKVKKQAGK